MLGQIKANICNMSDKNHGINVVTTEMHRDSIRIEICVPTSVLRHIAERAKAESDKEIRERDEYNRGRDRDRGITHAVNTNGSRDRDRDNDSPTTRAEKAGFADTLSLLRQIAGLPSRIDPADDGWRIDHRHYTAAPPAPSPKPAPEKAPVSCKCGKPGVIRTVQKDGENKGRKFYCCDRKGMSCDYFAWEYDYANNPYANE